MMQRKTRSTTATLGAVLVSVGVAVAGAGAAQGSEPQPVISGAAVDVSAPALSYTGRYVAYRAIRRDQSSPAQQVRRTDLTTGGWELLNPSIDGGIARGNYSFPPVISSDGRRVSFSSTATRLVAGDTNGKSDAFVRDTSADFTFLTSVGYDGDVANGATGMTSLSKNGQYAVFTSDATDVVPGSTTTNNDVYRRDLTSGTTEQVTVRPDDSPSRGPGASTADVSANGNLVAFSSYNSDLTKADGADGETDLFLRNMTTKKTRWLSEGVPAGANPAGVVISPDGRWVSSRWDDGSLHLTEVATGDTTTVAAEGYALLGSFSSAAGRLVYLSGGLPYVRDLSTGTSTAIDVPSGGFATVVTISGDGQFAAYDWVPDGGGPSVIYRVAL